MHTFIKRALLGAFIGGGIAVLGAGVAHAADTTGDDGLLSGTQALLGVEAPLTVGGNAISVLGDSSSADAGTTDPAPPAPAPAGSTSGEGGAASGTQALVTVSVPVTVSGNGISVLGDSASDDALSTAPSAAPAEPAEPATTDAAAPTTSGDDAIAGGTQVIAPITTPVTVGDNAISVLGESASDQASTGGTGIGDTGPSGSEPITAGDDGILSGTQLALPVSAPVTLGGNAISVIGDSASTGAQTAGTAPTSATAEPATTVAAAPTTSGDDATTGGTQVIAPLAAPVTVSGNGISLVGDSASTGAMSSGVVPGSAGTGGTDAATSGENSILGGTQLGLPVAASVSVDGNAISVIGDSTTTEPVADPTDPGTTDPGDPTSPGTSVDGTDGAILTGGLASVVGAPAGAALAQTGGNGDAALLALAVGAAAIAAGLGLRLGRTARLRR